MWVDRLKKAHIISDTLDDFEPSCYLRVFYDSHHEEVFLGNKIKPSHTKEAPKIRIFCPKSKAAAHSKGYTIALTDPDAPSRKDPKWSEMCHWIATVAVNGTVEEFSLDGEDQKLKDVAECTKLHDLCYISGSSSADTSLRQASWAAPKDWLPSLCLRVTSWR